MEQLGGSGCDRRAERGDGEHDQEQLTEAASAAAVGVCAVRNPRDYPPADTGRRPAARHGS
jgi:hypothetical protein